MSRTDKSEDPDQTHTLNQADAAARLRDYLILRADPDTADTARAAIRAYQHHLTPLCQLAGGLEVAVTLLRLGQQQLEWLWDQARPPGWLFDHVTARTGITNPEDLLAGRSMLQTAFDDVLRTDGGVGCHIGGRRAVRFTNDETVQVVAALVHAIDDGDDLGVRVLLADSDLTALLPVVLARIDRLAKAVGELLHEPPGHAILLSGYDTGTFVNVAAAYGRGGGRS